MKTRSWGLLVLIQLYLFVMKNGADVSTDGTAKIFYNIGHMTNELTQVEKHLAEGANALEINVQFSPQGRPVRTHHGFPCCFLNCFASEVFNYMLQYLRDLTTPEHPNYQDQLSLIMLDLRVRTLPSNMLYTAGERLTEALLVYLFDGGYSGSNVWVLLSVPSTQHAVLFQGVRDAFRKYQMTGLLDKIGYNIGDNTDLASIERSLDTLGINYHVWVGDGSPRCLGGIRSRSRIQRLIEERDIGEAHFDRVYHWTVDDPLTMRNSLRMGVDGIVTNRPDRILEILSEDEFYGRFRLATADDRPWEKVIPDESLLNFLPPSEAFVGSIPLSDAEPVSASSSIVFGDDDTDSSRLTESELKDDSKDSKDCTESPSISEELSVGKEADEPVTFTTEIPIDSDDIDLSTLIDEVESSASDVKKSVVGRSADIFDLITAKNKELDVNSNILNLLSKRYSVSTSPTVPLSVLQALLSAPSATPEPTIPVDILRALMAPSAGKSINLLQLLTGAQPTPPSLNPDVVRALLELYVPSTTPAGVPLPLVKALINGVQTPPTLSINAENLKLLSSLSVLNSQSNSDIPLNVLLSLVKPKSVLSRFSTNDDDKIDFEEKVTTTTAKVTEKTKLSGKEVLEEETISTKNKSAVIDGDDSDGFLPLQPPPKEKRPKGVTSPVNRTRSFPFFPEGGPPLPPYPGTTVVANFGPEGVHWKVLDRPGGFPPLPFNGGGPPLIPFQGRPITINRQPIVRGYLPTTVNVHPPIHLQRPIPLPNRPIRLPDKINIHVPIPDLPLPVRQHNHNQYPPVYLPPPYTTPCPEPVANNFGYHNYHGHHASSSNNNQPAVPIRPIVPQEPFQPPVFDDFLRSHNNFSKDVPKDLFKSPDGSAESNKSSIENLGLDITTEPADVVSKSDESVFDILHDLDFSEETKTTPLPPTGDPFHELLAAFEKINNNKEMVANFLRRVNLTESITTTETSLSDTLNLPPTKGLGWDGHEFDEDKLDKVIPKVKKPLEVIVIETAPIIIVPTAIPQSHSTVSKRETTPPPSGEENFFDTNTEPMIMEEKLKPGGHVTISKPSEGFLLDKDEDKKSSGGGGRLREGELEIVIPGELFTQKAIDESKTINLSSAVQSENVQTERWLKKSGTSTNRSSSSIFNSHHNNERSSSFHSHHNTGQMSFPQRQQIPGEVKLRTKQDQATETNRKTPSHLKFFPQSPILSDESTTKTPLQINTRRRAHAIALRRPIKPPVSNEEFIIPNPKVNVLHRGSATESPMFRIVTAKVDRNYEVRRIDNNNSHSGIRKMAETHVLEVNQRVASRNANSRASVQSSRNTGTPARGFNQTFLPSVYADTLRNPVSTRFQRG